MDTKDIDQLLPFPNSWWGVTPVILSYPPEAHSLTCPRCGPGGWPVCSAPALRLPRGSSSWEQGRDGRERGEELCYLFTQPPPALWKCRRLSVSLSLSSAWQLPTLPLENAKAPGAWGTALSLGAFLHLAHSSAMCFLSGPFLIQDLKGWLFLCNFCISKTTKKGKKS